MITPDSPFVAADWMSKQLKEGFGYSGRPVLGLRSLGWKKPKRTTLMSGRLCNQPYPVTAWAFSGLLELEYLQKNTEAVSE